jgi:hypothetical protein
MFQAPEPVVLNVKSLVSDPGFKLKKYLLSHLKILSHTVVIDCLDFCEKVLKLDKTDDLK